MKDENGIEIKCENCDVNAQRDCNLGNAERGNAGSNGCRWYFYPSYKAYEARIEELQELASTLKHKLIKKEQERRHESSIRDKRIAELQKELNVVQESERAEAKEADRLREEIKEAKQIKESSESFYQRYSGVSEEYALGALEECATEADELQAKIEELENKLTETVKLLSERSRKCGELEAYNEVLQRRIQDSGGKK